MTTNKLTAIIVRNAKPKNENGILKENRLPDGGGLYLLVIAKGNKLWRYGFSYKNKKFKLASGKMVESHCFTF